MNKEDTFKFITSSVKSDNAMSGKMQRVTWIAPPSPNYTIKLEKT